jgi:hypothetical protein
MIKKSMVWFLVFLLLVSLASATTSSTLFSTEDSNSYSVRLTTNNYVPQPAQPGQYVDVYLSLETQETYQQSIINLEGIKDVEIEFVESYPFTLDPSEEAITYLGDLEHGERVTLKYRLFIDETAANDDHKMNFIYRSKATPNGVEVQALEIPVQTIDTTISITDIVTNPEQLSPGTPATLTLTVRNDAFQTFTNLEATINIDGSTVPIVPYQSTKEQTLRSLAEGEEYSFNYQIIVEEDAEAGVYKIPFTLIYSDTNNTKITKEDTFGVLIGAEGDLEFNLEEFETFQKGKTGEIVVSVSNVGPTGLKFMTMELLEGEEYVVIGRNKEYLGNLDSDDFETSTFTVNAKSKEDIPLQLRVTYKDTYNKEYIETVYLNLPVYSQNEIRAYGLNGDSKTPMTYIIYVLIIAFIVYTFKGWKMYEKKFDRALKHGLTQTVKFPFRVILFFRPKNLIRIPQKIKRFFSDL